MYLYLSYKVQKRVIQRSTYFDKSRQTHITYSQSKKVDKYLNKRCVGGNSPARFGINNSKIYALVCGRECLCVCMWGEGGVGGWVRILKLCYKSCCFNDQLSAEFPRGFRTWMHTFVDFLRVCDALNRSQWVCTAFQCVCVGRCGCVCVCVSEWVSEWVCVCVSEWVCVCVCVSVYVCVSVCVWLELLFVREWLFPKLHIIISQYCFLSQCHSAYIPLSF